MKEIILKTWTNDNLFLKVMQNKLVLKSASLTLQPILHKSELIRVLIILFKQERYFCLRQEYKSKNSPVKEKKKTWTRFYESSLIWINVIWWFLIFCIYLWRSRLKIKLKLMKILQKASLTKLCQTGLKVLW